MPEYDGLLALDRFERAVEKVRDRLLRVTARNDPHSLRNCLRQCGDGLGRTSR